MSKNIQVLVIDDERNLVRSIKFSLQDENIEVVGVYTGQEGLQAADESSFDLVLLDLGLPDQSGLDVLVALKQKAPELPVIMISAHGDTRAAVSAVKQGAVDYITKPFDHDELVMLIRKSSEQSRMLRELNFLRSRDAHTSALVGTSAAMENLRYVVSQVGASAGKTVLITGPSGTGKALIARSLHEVRFGSAPFIEVNCAALPEQLIEAELFGAEKGAYTGAHQRRAGLVDLADGGTLFLDEIGEMPLALQAKLLNFLESRKYRPIGGTRERQAEVFVVAATNRPMKDEVEAGRFRADLYYRLNVLPIDAPPLRDRLTDLPLLVAHFGSRFARQEGCSPCHWGSDVLSVLQSYAWPGNVRELKNLVERLTILYPGQAITPQTLPPEYRIAGDTTTVLVDEEASYQEVIEQREKQLIISALAECGGRKGLAADRLGISRHALKRRIQRLGLEA
ncbi:MAG: sigma-54-dependent transcriptional regulator [Pontibacterium sp.]